MSAPDYALIDLGEVAREIQRTPPCPDCSGGLGLCVDLTDPNPDQAWDVVQQHSVPCPVTSRKAAAS